MLKSTAAILPFHCLSTCWYHECETILDTLLVNAPFPVKILVKIISITEIREHAIIISHLSSSVFCISSNTLSKLLDATSCQNMDNRCSALSLSCLGSSLDAVSKKTSEVFKEQVYLTAECRIKDHNLFSVLFFTHYLLCDFLRQFASLCFT